MPGLRCYGLQGTRFPGKAKQGVVDRSTQARGTYTKQAASMEGLSVRVLGAVPEEELACVGSLPELPQISCMAK